MKVWGYFRSSAAFRVRIALALKGLEPEQAFVHLRKAEQRTPEYLAKNPLGLVPTLEDGPATITQSLAICEYLDETHKAPPLLPPDPLGRARVRAIAYAIACDRRGYVPTHNSRYCQALTGDEKLDMAGNRTKRIFDDPVGSRCGDHRLPFLLQTYRRDTGEIMHDMSAPVMVKGRHWGGVRVGYRTE